MYSGPPAAIFSHCDGNPRLIRTPLLTPEDWPSACVSSDFSSASIASCSGDLPNTCSANGPVKASRGRPGSCSKMWSEGLPEKETSIVWRSDASNDRTSETWQHAAAQAEPLLHSHQETSGSISANSRFIPRCRLSQNPGT